MARNGTEWTPRPRQAKVLEEACVSGFDRNVTSICGAAGVPLRTFYNWMRDDVGFRQAWADLWRDMVTRHLPGVVAASIARAQGGDVPAQRLLAEIAGIVKNQVEQSGELRIVYVNDWRGDGRTGASDPLADAASGPDARHEEREALQPASSGSEMAQDNDVHVDLH